MTEERPAEDDGSTGPDRPLFPDVGILSCVPDRWGGEWLSRHQILNRLGRYFNVVWVDPPLGWREIWLKQQHQRREILDVTPPANGVEIHPQSPWLPKFFKPHRLDLYTQRKRLESASRVLKGRGVKKTILYLWRPDFATAVDLIPHDVSCYHIVDEYTFSDIELPVEENEARLISRADQVFIHSPALMEKKGGLNPNTKFVTNGVDYSAFSSPVDEPEDLRNIPHPRIGYVGRIKKQINWEVVSSLVERRPDWSFVFVGPKGRLGQDEAIVDRLFQEANVHYLGHRRHDELPGYTQHLDVCLMCYRLTGYTKFIYPLKLHEYLASGRPVVGSPIPSLQEFASIIRLADTPDEWERAIVESLSDAAGTIEEIGVRQAMASRYDWERLVQVIASTLCERLGPGFAEKMAQLRVSGLVTSG